MLGLEMNANSDQIKRAFRQYASKLHPDKHSGDVFFEERFIELMRAYEILRNNESRMMYDQQLFKYGHFDKSEIRDFNILNQKIQYQKQSFEKEKQRIKDEFSRRLNLQAEEFNRTILKQKELFEIEKRKMEEEFKIQRKNDVEFIKREKHLQEINEIRAARINHFFYSNSNISINGYYVNYRGRSYILDHYDKIELRSENRRSYVGIGLVLILIGLLTLTFFVGIIFLSYGIFALFYKDYFVVLVGQNGDVQLISGRKIKMKKIARIIQKAKLTAQY